jgi:hypothetical protein
MKQLLLFPETLEASLLRQVQELKDSHKETKDSLSKVRKGQFAKLGDLTKKYTDLCSRLDVIEAGLCRMQNPQESTCEILEMALM